MFDHAGLAPATVSQRADRRAIDVPSGVIVARTAMERLAARIAMLPLPVRRSLLKAAMWVQWARGFQPDPAIVFALRKALSLPRRRAERMARRTVYQTFKYTLECLAVIRRPVSGLLRDGRAISTKADAELRWIAAQPGAVIATLHFGPYLIGLAWLLHRYCQGRRVVIVKSSTSSADEQRAIDRIAELGVELHMMAPESPADHHRLLRFVRGGGIAIIMVDLPREYGKTRTLDLIALPMDVAQGALDLAAICAVPMALCRFRSLGLRDVVEVEGMFDVDRRRPATLERARTGIDAAIGRTLRDHPDQWHMWSFFDRYLPLPDSGAN